MKKHFSFITKTHSYLIIVLLVVGLIASIPYVYRCVTDKVCGNAYIDRLVRHEVTITFPKGEVLAEMADTVPARERGLSGRNNLEEGRGMLFVFDKSGKYGFWMKDMTFPIDIVWLSQTGLVVHIVEHAQPEDYPDKTYINAASASYVLELPQGKAKEYGLYVGAKVDIGK